jgi:hypothetical protein
MIVDAASRVPKGNVNVSRMLTNPRRWTRFVLRDRWRVALVLIEAYFAMFGELLHRTGQKF